MHYRRVRPGSAAARPSWRVALAIGAGILAMLIYGGQFVVSRWSMQRTLSLWDLAAIRFAAAGVLVLPLIARHGFRSAAGIGWRRAAVLAITAGAPYTLVMYAGLVFAPAAHGAVVISGLTPLVSALLVRLWLGERSSATTVVGLVLIVLGLALVGWPVIRAAESSTWVGDLLLAAAGVLWALFTVLTRRWQIDPLRGTAMVWLLALAYVPVYGAIAGARVFDAPAGELVFQAIYQGAGVAVGALALYAWSIRVLGVLLASFFMPLVVVFGVLLAVPVLGEVPAPIQLLGMVGVSIGMVLAALRQRA